MLLPRILAKILKANKSGSQAGVFFVALSCNDTKLLADLLECRNSEVQVLLRMSCRYLDSDSCLPLWNHRVAESNDINSFL
mmetsp:Transcript_1565/g.4530  ORF Transcript_1565/g.4530 Transcript_1565/m.4530 type:complete len:81 (+) Transcript_1565:181-423(+)